MSHSEGVKGLWEPTATSEGPKVPSKEQKASPVRCHLGCFNKMPSHDLQLSLSSVTLSLTAPSSIYLPTLDTTTVVLKQVLVQRLGQEVRQLVQGITFQDNDFSILLVLLSLCHMTPKVMPLAVKVLSAIGDPLVDCKKQGSLVVFKDSAADR